MPTAKPTILYIGGYGRSGSTLLEMLLCKHDRAWGLGEVAMYSGKQAAPESQCTCGELSGKCLAWGKLHNQDTNLSHLDALEQLVNSAPEEARLIIDGSKTAWRRLFSPFFARRRFGSQFMMAHIIRHPCGVIWSTLKGSNRKLESGQEIKNGPVSNFIRVLRTSAGWSLANLTAYLFGAIYRDRYIRINYEVMVSDPELTIKKILQRADLEGISLKDAPELGNRHQLFGNRSRWNSDFVIRSDNAWKESLGWFYRLMGLTLTAPVRLLALWPSETNHRT